MQNIWIRGLEKINDFKSGLSEKQDSDGPQDPYLMIPKGQKKKKLEEKQKALEAKNPKKTKKADKTVKKAEAEGDDDVSDDGGVINYQYNVSKRNEVHATKLFNDPMSMFHYLIGRDGYFFTQENFQWKFMRDLPKLLWKTERMEDIGDFVLLFPNPDQIDPKDIPLEAENGIDFDTAQEYFSQILETQYNYPNKKKFFKSLKDAFKLAFMELDEYKPLDEKEKKKLKKAEKTEQPEVKQNKAGQAYQDANAPNVSEPIPTENAPLKKEGENNTLDKSAANASPGPKSATDLGQAGNTEKSDAEKKDGEAASQKELAKKRRVWAGQFYLRPKAPEKDKNPRHAQWKRNPDVAADGKAPKARDFLTIMRRCIIAVLANQGFLMREVFVDDGKWIALVLTMPEENLKNFAREIGLQKPVEFGCSDLMSLEPIDYKKRPMRINAYLLDEKLWEQRYLADVSDQDTRQSIIELRKFITTMLEDDCDFKSIVRMCGGVWHSYRGEESAGNVMEHAVVELEEWYAYRSFLVELSFHIHEIRLLNQKMMYILNSYYNRDRLSFHGNHNRKKVDAIEIFKITSSLVVNAFKMCMGKDYEGSNFPKTKLRNMWDEMGCAPREYMFPYEPPHNNMRPRIRTHYERIWVEELYIYQPEECFWHESVDSLTPFEKIEKCLENYKPVNMQEVISAKSVATIFFRTFGKVETIKIVNTILNKLLNLTKLQQFYTDMSKKQVSQLIKVPNLLSGSVSAKQIGFPLHDRNLTEGKDLGPTFRHLWELKHYFENVLQEHKTVQVSYKGPIEAVFGKPVDQGTIFHKSANKASQTQSVFGQASSVFDKSFTNLSQIAANQKPELDFSLLKSAKPAQPKVLGSPRAASARSSSLMAPRLAIDQSVIRPVMAQPDDPDSHIPPEYDFDVKNLPKLAIPNEREGERSALGSPRSDLSQSRRSKKRKFSLNLTSMEKSIISQEHMNMNLLKNRLGMRNSFTVYQVQKASKLPTSNRARLVKFEEANMVALIQSRKRVQAGLVYLTASYYSGITSGLIKRMNRHSGLGMRSQPKVGSASPRSLQVVSELNPDEEKLIEASQEIRSLYQIDHIKLIDSMLQAFITVAGVRGLVIPQFPKLGLEPFKSLIQQSRPLDRASCIKRSMLFDSFRTLYREGGLPLEPIIHYFGENYALFFSFMNMFQKRTWLISIEFLAIFVYICYYYYLVDLSIRADSTDEEYDAHIARFTGYHYVFWVLVGWLMLRAIDWACRIHKEWEDFETEFQSAHGMPHSHESDVSSGTQRFKFLGRLMRNLVSDQINDSDEDKKKVHIIVGVIALVNVLFFAASVISAFYLLHAKRYCTKRAIMTQISIGQLSPQQIADSFNFIDQAVFNLFEILRCRFFNTMYFSVMKRLAIWRNYRYMQDHETFLIFSKVAFEFVNLGFVPFVMYFQAIVSISINSDGKGGWTRNYLESIVCIQYNCPVELTFLMVVNSAANLLYPLIWQTGISVLFTYLQRWKEMLVQDDSAKVPLMLSPKVGRFLGLFSGLQGNKSPSAPLSQQSESSSVSSYKHYMELDPEKLAEFIKKHDLPVTEFQASQLKNIKSELLEQPEIYYDGIYKEIDSQCTFKKDSQTGGDLDENFDYYLEVVRSFIQTMMFVCPAPAQFFALWVTANVNFFNQARNLVLRMKRPVPWTAKTIGIWKDLMLAMIYMSAISNSLYFGFIALQFRITYSKLLSFGLFLMVTMFLINYRLSDSEEGEDNAGEVLGHRSPIIKKLIFPKVSQTKKVAKSVIMRLFKSQKVQGEYHKVTQDGIWDLAQKADEDIERQQKDRAEKEIYSAVAAKNTADYVKIVTAGLKTPTGLLQKLPESKASI